MTLVSSRIASGVTSGVARIIELVGHCVCTLPKAVHRGAECRSVRSAEIFFFQLSGWALVAPSCFALQVQYVRGSMLQRNVSSGEGGPEPEHL